MQNRIPCRIGYQGEPGAFSETAAQQMMPDGIPTPVRSFPELFNNVASGNLPYGAVAVENALAGSVQEVYDLLLEHRDRVTILQETQVRIVHHLIGLPGATFSDIRHVYSHAMALLQCQKFFREHDRRIEASSTHDTAGSVRKIVGDKLIGRAAIASARCAEIYGGTILRENIGDDPENYTRFFLISRRDQQDLTMNHVPGNKTSIVFTIDNKPGKLVECLHLFARFEINLTKIESRPIPGKPWAYSFYLDFAGNPADGAGALVLKCLPEITTSLHVLGCYAATKQQTQ